VSSQLDLLLGTRKKLIYMVNADRILRAAFQLSGTRIHTWMQALRPGTTNIGHVFYKDNKPKSKDQKNLCFIISSHFRNW
jgi:hypothetical protein